MVEGECWVGGKGFEKVGGGEVGYVLDEMRTKGGLEGAVVTELGSATGWFQRRVDEEDRSSIIGVYLTSYAGYSSSAYHHQSHSNFLRSFHVQRVLKSGLPRTQTLG